MYSWIDSETSHRILAEHIYGKPGVKRLESQYLNCNSWIEVLNVDNYNSELFLSSVMSDMTEDDEWPEIVPYLKDSGLLSLYLRYRLITKTSDIEEDLPIIRRLLNLRHGDELNILIAYCKGSNLLADDIKAIEDILLTNYRSNGLTYESLNMFRLVSFAISMSVEYNEEIADEITKSDMVPWISSYHQQVEYTDPKSYTSAETNFIMAIKYGDFTHINSIVDYVINVKQERWYDLETYISKLNSPAVVKYKMAFMNANEILN